MATRKQEISHAIAWFFQIYTVVLFMKVWFPTQDFFRRIWWKAWGHDPKKDINFHLSQIKFDHETGNRILMSSAVHRLAGFLYGETRVQESVAWLQFAYFSRFKYLPYDDYMAIYELYEYQFPGQPILDWFMKTDGISADRIKSVRAFNPEFELFYQELMTTEKHKPKE
jgi:hypothetical protein